MFVHKQRETRRGRNKRREWETKRRGMRGMRGEVNGVETNLKIPLQGWFLVQLCESSCSNPRIYAPTGNCKCKLRWGNYVFTDLCIREKQTSRSFHVHVDFRFSPVLSTEVHGIALSSFRRANNLPARALLSDNEDRRRRQRRCSRKLHS